MLEQKGKSEKSDSKGSRRDFLGGLAALGLSTGFGGQALAQESGRGRVLGRNQLAEIAVKGSVQLIMKTEGQEATGSGAVIKTPPALEPLLRDDEVLVVSASHNLWNWNSDTNLIKANYFYNFDSQLRAKNYQSFSGRLLGRYVDSDLTISDGFVDISIVAIQVPFLTQDGAVNRGARDLRANALSVAESTKHIDLGDRFIAAGSPGSTAKKGTQKSTPPIVPKWRDGQFIMRLSRESTTNYGRVAHDVFHTTVKAISGDSGGPLLDTSGALVGICSGGDQVSLNTVDFGIPDLQNVWLIPPGGNTSNVPPDVIVVHSQTELEREHNKINRAVLGFAMDSEWRGSYQDVTSFHRLVDKIAEEYTSLKEEEKNTQQVWQEVQAEFENNPARDQRILPAIRKNFSERLRTIRQKLKKLRPDR